jgi:hypothetical protein
MVGLDREEDKERDYEDKEECGEKDKKKRGNEEGKFQ